MPTSGWTLTHRPTPVQAWDEGVLSQERSSPDVIARTDPINSGHDFSRISLNPPGSSPDTQALGPTTQSCPLAMANPQACPFGGVCHTCPARAQTKLAISQPGDEYEQEADRVADAVMRMPDTPQRGTWTTGVRSRAPASLQCRARKETGQPAASPTGAPRAPTPTEAGAIETARAEASRRCQRAMFQVSGLAFAQQPPGDVRRIVQTILDWRNPDMDRVRDTISAMAGALMPGVRVMVAQPADPDCVGRDGYVGATEPIVLCPRFFTSGAERQVRTTVHESAHLAGIRNPGPGEGYCIVYDCASSCPGGRTAADSWSHLVHCLSGQAADVPVQTVVPRPQGTNAPGRPQRKANDNRLPCRQDSSTSRAVEEVLRTPGQPLDPAARTFMEARLGHDFSQVRVHTDRKAAESAQAVNALAYTVGRDVVFGAHQYAPSNSPGRELLAHELAHVTQQGASTKHKPEPLRMTSPDCPAEREADAISQTVVRAAGETALRGGSLQISRRPESSSAPALPTVSVGHFRNSGSTADSGENNCANCPRELGVHHTDFRNGMELRGDITGHRPDAQYDFKRTREGGIWKKVGGRWIQTFHDGPGANDDRTDADEQLTPINNHIYAEDIPGLGANPAGGDATATEAVLKGSFVEWVNVRVGTGSWTKCSNECEWHSVSWVEKVSGSWRRKAGNNEISLGTTTVGTGDP